MAEEPQPSNVQEGANEESTLPTNAEDRKAAAALSSLDARGDDDDTPSKKDVDAEALGKAMKDLDDKDGAKAQEAAAKKVKIDAADVALLVEQLELSKTKATELLRSHEGDAVKAMTAYVTAPV